MEGGVDGKPGQVGCAHTGTVGYKHKGTGKDKKYQGKKKKPGGKGKGGESRTQQKGKGAP